MGKLDHNLDAYRLAATTLERLRALIRRHLQAAHGPDWETTALPDDPAQFLAQRRARESSVKWNPSSATDLLDFAGFCNLHEILNTHPRLRDGFARLVPEPQTLRLRFLELDTVLNRIAYARPVSDSDMELLLGFDERLRQLVSRPRARRGRADGRERGRGAGGAGRRQSASRSLRSDRRRRHPPPAAARPTSPRSPQPRCRSPRPTFRPPSIGRAARRRSRTTAARARALAPDLRPHDPAAGARERRRTSLPVTAPRDLETALRRGDDRAVLTILYQEITALAEQLWSDSASARAPMWEMVSESSWYRERFLRLAAARGLELLRPPAGGAGAARERQLPQRAARVPQGAQLRSGPDGSAGVLPALRGAARSGQAE